MLNDLVSLFYPRNCICCRQPLQKSEKDCCFICLTELPRTNFANYSDNPVAKLFWGRIQLTFGFSVFHFTKGGKLQSLMHGLKYREKTDVGEFLGREIGRELVNTNHHQNVDLIVPVPLHPKRLQFRGYNQSDFLAKGIHEIITKPMETNLVKRIVHTSSQTNKSKFERWQNVSAIFEVEKPLKIKDKNILLVDDVITTGSTLESCAHTLLTQGARSVAIAVVASGT